MTTKGNLVYLNISLGRVKCSAATLAATMAKIIGNL